MDNNIPIKVKIIDMEYNKENNLFKMHVERLEDGKKSCMAIKGTDFLITPDFPINIINDFCEQMKGKEKNLYIEFGDSLLNEDKKQGEISEEKINRLNEDIDKYPIKEIIEESMIGFNHDGNSVGE